MATRPVDELKIIERFGPHLALMRGERLSTSVEPDRLVRTHCCFCGQQCGIQLKVKDNEVIGFEPWEEFPFNRGMLCPKGVKRYRYTFFPLLPSELAPPYWINMGAVAISTLAGALLVLAAPASPLLTSLLPFLKGFALLFWSTATWWIPMLLVLGTWRHVVQGFPLKYDPLYWGAVFPLGMYTVCTIRLSQALDVPFLATLAGGFVFVALFAWLVVAAGWVVSIFKLESTI